MRKTNYLVFLVMFLCIALSAAASFSGKYLSVRKGGVTYKHRLYTTTAEAGTARLAARVGGTTLYSGLNDVVTTDGLTSSAPLRLRMSGDSKLLSRISLRNSTTPSVTYVATETVFTYDVFSFGTACVAFLASQRLYSSYFGTRYLSYSPKYMAIDSSDNIYVSDPGGITIYKYNAGGNFSTNYNASAGFLKPIFANSHFYAITSDWKKIVKYTTTFSIVSVSAQIGSDIAEFTVDENDNIYFIESGSSSTYKKSSWSGTTLATSLHDPGTVYGMAYLPDEKLVIVADFNSYGYQYMRLYVKDSNLGGIDRFNASIGNAKYQFLRAKNGKLYGGYLNLNNIYSEVISY